jgi:hypothetical protein
MHGRFFSFKTYVLSKHCFVFGCVVGVAETSTALGIEAMNPNSREEFDEFQAAISKKVQSFTKSPHFPAFAEELIRNICVNCKCTNRTFNWLRKKKAYEINIIVLCVFF